MKTYKELLSFESQSFDGRDLMRLSRYIKLENLNILGLSTDNPSEYKHIELTKESVLESLKEDLEFAFEKALDKRGLSSNAMYYVIKMWCWILNDDEHSNWSDNDYAYYGLPLYKSVALKYGFKNEIGEHVGNENFYSEDFCSENFY